MTNPNIHPDHYQILASPDQGSPYPQEVTAVIRPHTMLVVSRLNEHEQYAPVLLGAQTTYGLFQRIPRSPGDPVLPKDALQIVVGVDDRFQSLPPDRRAPIRHNTIPRGGRPTIGTGPHGLFGAAGNQKAEAPSTLLHPVTGPSGLHKRLLLGATIMHQKIAVDSGPESLQPGEIDPATVYGSITWDYERRSATITMPEQTYVGLGTLAVDVLTPQEARNRITS